MDHPVMSGKAGHTDLAKWLRDLAKVARETNQAWANRLDIPVSASITCVKPSGTVSQLVDSSSGIHPRFSKYYIRRVRGDKKDPVSQLMIDQGVPCEDDKFNPSTYVFSFPVKAPETATVVSDVAALDQLDLWEAYQLYWCEHKPSCTVYYNDNEFLEVGQWVWTHLDILSGVSFLPQSDHVYTQAPYEEITEEEYLRLREKTPKTLEWARLSQYEMEDLTVSQQTLACTGGVCEL